VECGAPQGSAFDCGGGLTLIRRSPDLESGVQVERGAAAEKPMPNHLGRRLLFAQRLTCTVVEACEVTGLGRTKIYELIGNGRVTTTTVGRRRLIIVPSLLVLVGVNAKPADHA
jgi:excisionase family DNA binding protein